MPRFSLLVGVLGGGRCLCGGRRFLRSLAAVWTSWLIIIADDNYIGAGGGTTAEDGVFGGERL